MHIYKFHASFCQDRGYGGVGLRGRVSLTHSFINTWVGLLTSEECVANCAEYPRNRMEMRTVRKAGMDPDE